MLISFPFLRMKLLVGDGCLGKGGHLTIELKPGSENRNPHCRSGSLAQAKPQVQQRSPPKSLQHGQVPGLGRLVCEKHVISNLWADSLSREESRRADEPVDHHGEPIRCCA